MAKEKKTVLKFRKRYSKWNRGEVAGFSPERAQRLIDKGFAKKLADIDKEESLPENQEGPVAAAKPKKK